MKNLPKRQSHCFASGPCLGLHDDTRPGDTPNSLSLLIEALLVITFREHIFFIHLRFGFGFYVFSFVGASVGSPDYYLPAIVSAWIVILRLSFWELGCIWGKTWREKKNLMDRAYDYHCVSGKTWLGYIYLYIHLIFGCFALPCFLLLAFVVPSLSSCTHFFLCCFISSCGSIVCHISICNYLSCLRSPSGAGHTPV